jgi:predicted transcriptional regulator
VAIERKHPMSETSQTIREKVHALAEDLPPDASWDDVIEEVRFCRAVEAGIAAANRDSFATDEEVRSAFARWGVKI